MKKLATIIFLVEVLIALAKGQSCPAPVDSRKPASFTFHCFSNSDEYSIGSFCIASCPSNYFLTGTKLIFCDNGSGSGASWDASFDDTQCIEKQACFGARRLCSPTPCDVESCPGVLNSRCVNNRCRGCSAEFYENGRKFNKTLCQPKGCPPHFLLAKCPSNLCDLESCPSFPDAICVVSGCGGCEAVFYDRSSGEVIPKFACPLNVNFPECLNTLDCMPPPFQRRTGCLGVPGAVASQPCTCELTFTHPVTGRVLSDEECAFECPDGKEIAECDSTPCDTLRCPRFPNATCTNDYCGQCAAVFTDLDTGAVIPSYDCPTQVGLNYPSSCQTLSRRLGSGLYRIRPDPSMLDFPVYCDMDTDGGGWTLVASVHENNIDGKCTVGDKWSSEEGRDAGNDLGSQNWENLLSFGRVESATSGDYKSPAYYAAKAKDVMIWHVPNETPLHDVSNKAFLKYYTTDGFLVNKGRTLRELFKEHATVRSAETSGLFPLLRRFNETIRSILSEVPDWHSYRYDGVNEIRDGDRDVYDTGNIVFFRVGNGVIDANENGSGMTDMESLVSEEEAFTRLVYNAAYNLQAGGEVQSASTYPFVTLAWIGQGTTNQERTTRFEYRVDSNFGADGAGRVSIYDFEEIIQRQMRATYTAFVISGADQDASICEVYFHIGSTELWNTTFPEDFERINWSRSTVSAANAVRFSGGSMANVLLGYALLSRENGLMVTRQQISNVLRRYMRIAENFQYHNRIESIAVPVTYETGDDLFVQGRLPTETRLGVDPGFIQFRALNSASAANVLCPGVRVRNADSSRVCIGGGNSAATDFNVCGDFAGWAGSRGDRGNETSPSETGRSLEDINSSILIFTR